MIKYYVNGKVLLQRLTGVQRFAIEIVRQIDIILDAPQWRHIELVIIIPNGCVVDAYKNIRVVNKGSSAFGLTFWEQFWLPIHAAGATLINFSGSCPILKLRQFIFIHDMVLWDFPNAYTWHYRAYHKINYWLRVLFHSSIYTVSNFSRERINAVFRLSIPESHVIYNASEHVYISKALASELFQNFDLEPQSYYLAVGSQNPTKNFEILVKAFTSSELRDKTLVVVGDRSKIFSSTQPLNVTPNIIRVGRLNDLELYSLYQHCDGFIFPSIYEGFGIPPLEALKMNCRVFCSDIPVLREVYGDAVTYFSPYDPWDLVRVLLAPTPVRSTFASLDYSWSASALKFLSTLDENTTS